MYLSLDIIGIKYSVRYKCESKFHVE